MKEFVLPSCPVLTMSKGFTVGPGQLSGIAFIMNTGDVGLCCFLPSRQSATVATVVAMGAKGGVEWAVCVVVVSVVSTGSSAPDGKAMAMMLSAFPLCCFCNLVCFSWAGD